MSAREASVIFCRGAAPGKASGPAVVSRDAMCFYLVDPPTGTVIEAGHAIEGRSIAGVVLVCPGGKGSSVVQADGLYQLAKAGTAPAAVVVAEFDTVLVASAVVVVCRSCDATRGLRTDPRRRHFGGGLRPGSRHDTVTISPVVHSLHRGELALPRVRVARQVFAVPPPVDVTAQVVSQWQRLAPRISPPVGAKVAVAVGSRGVDGLVPTVRAVVGELRSAGCEPFIVPAMGSHGGATAAGQTEVLAGLGITSDAVGAPIRATMEVVPMGAVADIPLCLDRFAAAASGIVLVNRVKPHTDFPGPMGSGLMKMLCIGLGNREGADRLHRAGVARDLGEIVREAAVALLRLVPVLFGVAIVENQQHRPARCGSCRARRSSPASWPSRKSRADFSQVFPSTTSTFSSSTRWARRSVERDSTRMSSDAPSDLGR